METPPPTPNTKPPLGRAFFIWLLAPVVTMAVATTIFATDNRNSELQGFGMIVSWLSLLAMIGCSVVCSMMVGKRRGGLSGVLTFLGIQVIYVSVAVAGCATMLGTMGLH